MACTPHGTERFTAPLTRASVYSQATNAFVPLAGRAPIPVRPRTCSTLARTAIPLLMQRERPRTAVSAKRELNVLERADAPVEHPARSTAEEGRFGAPSNKEIDTSLPSTTEDAEGGTSVFTARAYMLLAALLCGTNFAGVKILQDTFEPASLMAVRFGTAGLAMLPFLRGVTKQALIDGLETGVWLGLGYVMQSLALETAQAGTTAFLCSLTTVVCPIIEKVTGSPVSKQAWAAAATAVVGAGVLELGGGVKPQIGDLLALGQPVLFGYFFWKTEQAMARNEGQAIQLTTAQVLACVGVALGWVGLQQVGLPHAEGKELGDMVGVLAADGKMDLALAWVSLVSTALILYLETVALSVLSSSESAVVFSSEPLWGTLFASLLLSEPITPQTIAGGALIIGACLLRVVDLESLRARFQQ